MMLSKPMQIVVAFLAFFVPLALAARPSVFLPEALNPSFDGLRDASTLFTLGNDGFLETPRLLEVRFFNLHRQMLFSPILSSPLYQGHRPSEPIPYSPVYSRIVRIWRFTNTDHDFVGFHSRRALWRPEGMPALVDEAPSVVGNGTSLWGFAIAFAVGFAITITVFWTILVLKAAAQKYFMFAAEDYDMGVVYGYQALPSSESFEKDITQKEPVKQAAGKIDNAHKT